MLVISSILIIQKLIRRRLKGESYVDKLKIEEESGVEFSILMIYIILLVFDIIFLYASKLQKNRYIGCYHSYQIDKGTCFDYMKKSRKVVIGI